MNTKLLLNSKNITQSIGEFYNKYPFPGYELDEINKPEDLYFQANYYGKLLSDQIPENTKIVDIGCGTGRHSCLLGIKNRQVLGVDLSEQSLKTAESLRKKLNLKNVHFEKQDLFDLKLEYQADYILCIGVLHHTYDIKSGLKILLRYLKTGGYIILGLYNTYGRLLLNLFKKLNRIFFRQIEEMDYFINYIAKSEIEKLHWKMDQYHCPFEKTITISKLLKIFSECEVDFINSFPHKFNIHHGVTLEEKEDIFFPHCKGKTYEHIYNQIKWIFSEYNVGGLFMVIGKKK